MNNTTNLSVIAMALINGSTISDSKTARINAVNTSSELAMQWNTVCTSAYNSFYDYQEKVVNEIITGEHDPRRVAVTTTAYKDLKGIVDLIGEVNGHKLKVSDDLLNKLSELVYSDKKKLSGNALLTKSKINNYKTELADCIKANSENTPANVERINAEIEKLEKQLKIDKIQLGSAQSDYKRWSVTTFRNKLELRLAMFINQQALTPRAILDEQARIEAEKRKNERKNARKNRRQEQAKTSTAQN